MSDLWRFGRNQFKMPEMDKQTLWWYPQSAGRLSRLTWKFYVDLSFDFEPTGFVPIKECHVLSDQRGKQIVANR